MQRFYRSWISGQTTTAGSLRSSKLNWLNDPKVSYQHKLPYYWAALNYSGNPAPLTKDVIDGKTNSLPGWMIELMISLAAIILLIVVLRIRR